MARIKKELTELIGGTPLLELSRLSKKHDAKAQIIAKLEYFNPGGSVKDRIALAMIEDAEAKGISTKRLRLQSQVFRKPMALPSICTTLYQMQLMLDLPELRLMEQSKSLVVL